MPTPDSPVSAAQMSDVSRVISAALAPVVLVSSVAILLSGFSSRYGSVSSQMRDLAREWRAAASPDRRDALRRQLALFRPRLRALWLANLLLALALLAFVGTVVAVALGARRERLGLSAAALLGTGLLLVAGAAVLICVELQAARRTADIELEDVLGPEPADAVQPDAG
jgi:hypothetical protein